MNPLYGPPGLFAGMRIVEKADMVEYVGEDWSKVRSPSRAARRRRQGHRQNIRPIYESLKEAWRVGNTLYMHPTMVQALRQNISAQ